MKLSARHTTNLDAHHRLLFSLIVAALAFAFSGSFASLHVRIITAWNAFALTSSLLAWSRILFARAKASARNTRLQDSSYTAIFLFVIIAAVASIFAVAALLGSAKDLSRARATAHIVLAALTVVSSWFLVHTLFTLRYADLYYHLGKAAADGSHGSGLDFPNEKQPDFLDFAYFSFIIGMTCQVSDVQVTSRRIRRVALVHGLLAFLFNTVILALTINLASSLL